ncbi:hypothetical protein ACH41H_09730 [Streptomyces sp. NPDC020800]|uniref:hypothetical protein n=1 Tax=Streptomyces sp. NPDC020800 TaxID=3365092 RepID=UPI0037916AE8
MFSRKKIAAVSGLLGGLAVTCTGVAQVHAAGGPGSCTRDIQGNVTCVQRIEGELPEDGVMTRQDNCLPTQPLTIPAALGNGQMRIGPEITCSSASPGTDRDFDLPHVLG